MKLYLNGQVLDEQEARISPADHGFLYGDGVYETLQYKNGKILNLASHIKRLQQSAELLRIKVPKVDFEKIILELINENQLDHARIRITVTRGENNFSFHDCKEATILITAQAYESGKTAAYFSEKTQTCSIQLERTLPKVKSTQLLPMILAKQKIYDEGVDECFFVDIHNYITEGSVSNFFAVKNSSIYTPPLNQCLEGTIRKKLKEICKKESINFEETMISYNDLQGFEACFWTNAIVHIAPIEQLDNFTFDYQHPLIKKLQALLRDSLL